MQIVASVDNLNDLSLPRGNSRAFRRMRWSPYYLVWPAEVVEGESHIIQTGRTETFLISCPIWRKVTFMNRAQTGRSTSLLINSAIEHSAITGFKHRRKWIHWKHLSLPFFVCNIWLYLSKPWPTVNWSLYCLQLHHHIEILSRITSVEIKAVPSLRNDTLKRYQWSSVWRQFI